MTCSSACVEYFQPLVLSMRRMEFRSESVFVMKSMYAMGITS